MNNEVYEELKKTHELLFGFVYKQTIRTHFNPKNKHLLPLGRLLNKRGCYFKGFNVLH